MLKVNIIIQKNNHLTDFILFGAVIIIMYDIGKELFLPQIALVMMVVILVGLQLVEFHKGLIGKPQLFLYLFISLGFVAWVSFFYFGYVVWFTQGTLEPDFVHIVEMNNHGDVRYITEPQNKIISILKIWGFLALLTALISGIYKKYAKQKSAT